MAGDSIGLFLPYFFPLLANIEGINTTEARRSALKMFDFSLELEIQWEGLAGSNLLGLCKEKLWVSQSDSARE